VGVRRQLPVLPEQLLPQAFPLRSESARVVRRAQWNFLHSLRVNGPRNGWSMNLRRRRTCAGNRPGPRPWPALWKIARRPLRQQFLAVSRALRGLRPPHISKSTTSRVERIFKVLCGQRSGCFRHFATPRLCACRSGKGVSIWRRSIPGSEIAGLAPALHLEFPPANVQDKKSWVISVRLSSTAVFSSLSSDACFFVCESFVLGNV